MPNYQMVYQTQASDYDLLVTREDYQNNLGPALRAIHPLTGSIVIEFGAGTGRLTRLIAPLATSILACDVSLHMLQTASLRLQQHHLQNYTLLVADNRKIPIRSQVADIAIAGWTFGHFVGWYPDSWAAEISRVLAEMKRLLRSGGVMIILETMGTGVVFPHPPHAGLAMYYQWLENEHGFATAVVQTDYCFESVAEAERLTRFFFGDALANQVTEQELQIVPEYTGIWWRKI
jgi:ubiquinone/menaquinone biosynthesis C-methylase UbiE